MHKAFTLLLLVAHVAVVGVPQGAGNHLAFSATTLGRGVASAAVVHAESKTSRSAAAAVLATRVPRTSRTGSKVAARPRPCGAERTRAVLIARTLSAAPPPVLRI